ncbi:MAG: histidinol dehydrogenase, partial [Clostridia bacterium]|nr:histidinol dehydrogenase [Clostridia bacterium]
MIRIYKYGDVQNAEIFARMAPKTDVSAAVAEILATVRADGDKAVFAYNEKFDGAKLESLAVTAEEIADARASVSHEFLSVLEQAAVNIRKF